jgi:hypothetical protein
MVKEIVDTNGKSKESGTKISFVLVIAMSGDNTDREGIHLRLFLNVSLTRDALSSLTFTRLSVVEKAENGYSGPAFAGRLFVGLVTEKSRFRRCPLAVADVFVATSTRKSDVKLERDCYPGMDDDR